MCPGMHTPRYEGTPPVVDAPPPVHMRPGMHTPTYEGTPPVVDTPPPVHMHPSMHNPCSGWPYIDIYIWCSGVNHLAN